MFSFSIVIPSYNRPAQLLRCLESIIALDYPRDLIEVLVIDDGSSVPYESVIAAFENRLNVRLLKQENKGPGSARNYGVKNARHDYVAFTDDDCHPDRFWLKILAQTLADCPQALVGGHTVNLLTENPFASASQLIADVVYRHYNRDPQNATFFATNNMALSRVMFEEMGGFDTEFYKAASEDREFCDRWRYSKNRMIYVPQAIIRHEHHMGLRSFLKQHMNYGRGAFHFHRIRSQRQSGSIIRETEFHMNLSNWLIRPIADTPGFLPKIRTLSLLTAWQVANAVGYFYEVARHSLTVSRSIKHRE
jgi:glycosyltransferase involved in cell wall biosynthesis